MDEARRVTLDLAEHHLASGGELADMRSHVPCDRLRITSAGNGPDVEVIIFEEQLAPADLGMLFPLIDVCEERADIPALLGQSYCRVDFGKWDGNLATLSL